MTDVENTVQSKPDLPFQDLESTAAEKLLTLIRTQSAAFFFDADGTLARFEPGNHDKAPHARDVEHILNDLHSNAQGAVAVITGRPKTFIDNAFPFRQFLAAGEHGAYTITPEGNVKFAGQDYDFHRIRSTVEKALDDFLIFNGAYVEDHKWATLTLQFTEAANPEQIVDDIKSILEASLDGIEQDESDPLRVEVSPAPGNFVGDILPASACKAKSMDLFMKDPAFAGKIPVAWGDSNGDSEMFRRAKELGGITVGVGPKAPKSDIHLADPEAVLALLQKINDIYSQDKIVTFVPETAQPMQAPRAASSGVAAPQRN